jgi:pilus assembly protein CpaE
MSEALKVVFVDPAEGSRDSLKSMLLGIDSLWMEADCSRYEFFTEIVKSSTPDIAIINLDSDLEKAIRTIETIRSTVPACSLLAVSKSTDHKHILRAIRAGAKEYLNTPIDREELMESIRRMVTETKSGTAESKNPCRVITVGGCSGGVGSTSIAVNLAAHFASDPAKRVILMDFDLSLGDTDIYLDMIPEYTLLDVVQNVDRLDESLLEKTLTKHHSGLYLLPRPVQLHDLEDIRAQDMAVMIDMIKSFYTHVVIDISKSYSQFDQLALKAASDVLMITQLDLPCLRNVVRLMMSFEQTEGLKEKTRVVMNRTGLNSGQVSLSKAEGFIGCDVYWQIPNDYKVMIDVRNNGVPLITDAPKAGITTAIKGLGDKLCGFAVEESSESSGKRSLFGFGSKR